MHLSAFQKLNIGFYVIIFYNDTRDISCVHDDIARYFACIAFLNFQLKAYRGISTVERRNRVSFVTHRKKGFARSASTAITVNNSYYRDIIVLECSRQFFVPRASPAASAGFRELSMAVIPDEKQSAFAEKEARVDADNARGSRIRIW